MTERTCSIDGCDLPHFGRGWCENHYRRWYRHGSPLSGRISPNSPVNERFWSKVNVSDRDRCWEWQAYQDDDGYGTFWIGGTHVRSHVVAWTLTNGEVPDMTCVLHRCDNPSCVNPEHLFLGSRTDNMRDMRAKGRDNDPVGERNGHAKLSMKEVKQIREIYARGGVSQSKLASIFSVGRSTIGHIVSRRTWRHVS